MAVHRYWRATKLTPMGSGGLDISEFQLLALTTRVDSPATLTSNIAPATGSLANLKDDNTSTGATWTAQQLKTLYLQWDFGATAGNWKDVTDICVGASSDPLKFLCSCGLVFSDNGTSWTAFDPLIYITGILWPGAQTKTGSTYLGTFVGVQSNAASGFVLDSTKTVAQFVGPNLSSMAYGTMRNAGVLQFEVQISSATPTIASIGVVQSGGYISNLNMSSVLSFNSLQYAWSGWTSPNFVSAGTSVAMGTTPVSGDVIGIVVNFTTGTLSVYKNGTLMGTATPSFLGMTLLPAVGVRNTGTWNATLRTSGFAFPIAGATEWEARSQINCGSPGRSSFVGSSAIKNPLSGYGSARTYRPAVVSTPAALNYVFANTGSVPSVIPAWAFPVKLITVPAVNTPASLNYAFTARSNVPASVVPSFRPLTSWCQPSQVKTGVALTYGLGNLTKRFQSRQDFLSGVLGQGIGHIFGSTKLEGAPQIPIGRRVRLIRQIDGLQMGEAWSDPVSGAFAFDWIDELQKYTLLAYDFTGTYDALVWADVVPTL